MPVIDNEQEIKQKSNILEYIVGDSGNNLKLLSKLYKIDTHWLLSVRKYVGCRGEENCMYCAAHYPILSEYRYCVELNGQKGYLDIKPKVFFDIQKIAKAQNKDVRQMSWTIIKTGIGKDTKYMASKNDNLEKDEYEKTMADLTENTNQLIEFVSKYEDNLDEKYTSYLKEIREQRSPKASGESSIKHATKGKDSEPEEAVIVEDEPDEPSDNGQEVEVKPDEIPF